MTLWWFGTVKKFHFIVFFFCNYFFLFFKLLILYTKKSFHNNYFYFTFNFIFSRSPQHFFCMTVCVPLVCHYRRLISRVRLFFDKKKAQFSPWNECWFFWKFCWSSFNLSSCVYVTLHTPHFNVVVFFTRTAAAA